MANIVIKDLEENQELDKKALEKLSGGLRFAPSSAIISRGVPHIYGSVKNLFGQKPGFVMRHQPICISRPTFL